MSSSSDVAAALDAIETPSVASVRAARVATRRDEECESFTGSELIDWARAVDISARSADKLRRPAAVSLPFEQRCAAIEKALPGAPSTCAGGPQATDGAVLAPSNACISPVSTLDLP